MNSEPKPTIGRQILSGARMVLIGAGALVCVGGIYILYHIGMFFGLVPTFAPDQDGNRPRDIVDQYLEHCQSGDYAKAAELWSDGSVDYMNKAFPDGFEGICQENAAQNLDYGWARYGKTNEVVHIMAEDESASARRFFYFVEEDGAWRIQWPTDYY